MSGLVIGVLRAHVKVLRKTADGHTMLEPTGGFGPDGKPILRKATRLVTVRKGEPLPDGLADGEKKRLQQLGALTDPGEPTPAAQPEPVVETVTVDVAKLAELDVSTIAAWIAADADDTKKAEPAPTVKTLLDAVGTDKALAAKVLEAEKLAVKGDGRSTLVGPLEKLIAADDGGQGQGQS